MPRVAAVVDQTGAGDVLAGTVAAWIALGDGLLRAVRIGVAAAALSVQGLGGTGFFPGVRLTAGLADVQPAIHFEEVPWR